jgi:hypothetical protein
MFGEFWPLMLTWAQLAFPRSLPALPPARSRSTWSAVGYEVSTPVISVKGTSAVGWGVLLGLRLLAPDTRSWPPTLTRCTGWASTLMCGIVAACLPLHR